MIYSFLFFLFLFLLIGTASVLKNRHTTVDYLLTDHATPPWIVGLSAVATNNSGYMFIGMIGYTYSYGLSSLWLLIGWVFGDFLISFLVHAKLRETSQKQNVHSYSAVLAFWQGKRQRILQMIGGLITILFLGTYAAAQFKAGSKALYALFGWEQQIGAILGCSIVILYCFIGGIRASLWTDVAQSFVMLIAMITLVSSGILELGGWGGFVYALEGVGDHYLALFPPDIEHSNFVVIGLFILGWFCAGVGVIGQPHIMLRYMALDDPSHIRQTRYYYYIWYLGFFALTIIAGLLARVYLVESASFDAELALPLLAMKLLNPVMTGLLLAGLFAATMSTADSQILTCTAALAHDFTKEEITSYPVVKFFTVCVGLIALGIALWGHDSVFLLVLLSWSVLGAAFAPLLILLCYNQKIEQWLACLMVVTSSVTALLFRELFPQVYEILPGMAAGFLVFMCLRGLQSRDLAT